MNRCPPLLPYQLLAGFLSPWGNPLTLRHPDRRVGEDAVDWQPLVYTANMHLCTPLWYVCMKNNGRLDGVPEHLRDYLQGLYRLNLKRNQALISALGNLLRRFNALGIDTVLLKGAACFCDQLYKDPGARILGDLDILIAPGHLETAQRILTESGFIPPHHPASQPEHGTTLYGTHHMPRLILPGTPVAVELHFKIGPGKSGEILSPEACWNHKQNVILNGQPTHIPDPTFRLLHNAVHALIQDRGFIRSTISLSQLSEFTHLVHTYREQINWNRWMAAGKASGVSTLLNAYLLTAHRVMGMPLPDGIFLSPTVRFHALRLIRGLQRPVHHPPLHASFADSSGSRLITAVLKLYYYCHLPLWAWQHIGYTLKGAGIVKKLSYLAGKALSSESRTHFRF